MMISKASAVSETCRPQTPKLFEIKIFLATD